ncbi:HAD family phosphatase [Arachnia propionica]|uniref:HAD family phosphatase n=1 Tax=Arachnia propionica TaxID=1750 RepID=A0A3P1WSD2_9ACTN|nr:HAD family phosphatase [Arachnia propionica]
MTFTPRLVALDIDGTIVDAEGNLPPSIRDAVHRVLAAGVPVVLATGRSWVSTKLAWDQLELPPGPVICANGAQILRYPPLELLHEVCFDPAATIAKVASIAPQAAIAVQDGLGWRVSRPFPPGELHGEMVIEPIERLGTKPAARVVIRDPNSSEEVFEEMVHSLGLHEVSYFVGWSAWLDIAPLGVDKAHALARVCADLGVDQADVLALGDGRNDIEMLTWAGRGVAMGNAPDEVRAVADHVTADFRAGGTVIELDRWFPGS